VHGVVLCWRDEMTPATFELLHFGSRDLCAGSPLARDPRAVENITQDRRCRCHAQVILRSTTQTIVIIGTYIVNTRHPLGL